MEDKLAGLLGMCRRAGRLTTGFDAVTALAAEGRAALILAASDVSEKTGKELRFALERAAPIRIPTDMSAASDYSRPSSSMIRRASSVLSITPRMASAPAP